MLEEIKSKVVREKNILKPHSFLTYHQMGVILQVLLIKEIIYGGAH